MNNWIKQWNFMRLLRLVLAIFIVFQGIETNQILFVIAGIIFGLLSLLNIGCCGSSCRNMNTKSKRNQNETTFTEIK